MNCRAYEDEDYSEIIQWFRERDLPVPSESSLPETGYIVPKIAAGFLYLTDSNVGILDCYIANDDAQIKERDLALDLITKSLIETAKVCGVRFLKADTQNNRIESRAIRHGFRCLGEYVSLCMEL